MTPINTDVLSGSTRVTGSGTTAVEMYVDYERTSKQSGRTRVSTSTKLPGTNKVTQPQVTPMVDIGASTDEALTRIVDSRDEWSH